jgi:dephospho-CoA kinase
MTGPSGSGKSTLALALKRRGWSLVDGDLLARGLYGPRSGLMKDLVRLFGSGVRQKDGSLNRVRLGEIVFSSLIQRRKLNALVYPLFLRALRRSVALARRQGHRVVADIAVYFDAGADLGAPVVLVDAPLTVRVQRLLRRGLSPSRARAQARALRFTAVERRRASAVLDGRLSPAALQRRLLALLKPAVS